MYVCICVHTYTHRFIYIHICINMYACICVHTYAHRFICIHVYIHIYIHICIHIHIYTHSYAHTLYIRLDRCCTGWQTPLYSNIRQRPTRYLVCPQVYIYSYIYTYIYTHMHTYTYTYTFIRTHEVSRGSFPSFSQKSHQCRAFLRKMTCKDKR